MPAQLSNAGIEAVRRSHDHAQSFGHDHIGTEHLLLGVLESSDRDPALKYIFGCFDLSLDKGEAVVLELTSTGPYEGKTHRPNTPHLVRAFQEAQLEAIRFGDELVRPRHLLLALIPESWQEHAANPTVAGDALARLGFRFADAKEAVYRELVRQERQSFVPAVYED